MPSQITQMNKVEQISFVLFLSEHHSITHVRNLDKLICRASHEELARDAPQLCFCGIWILYFFEYRITATEGNNQ